MDALLITTQGAGRFFFRSRNAFYSTVDGQSSAAPAEPFSMEIIVYL